MSAPSSATTGSFDRFGERLCAFRAIIFKNTPPAPQSLRAPSTPSSRVGATARTASLRPALRQAQGLRATLAVQPAPILQRCALAMQNAPSPQACSSHHQPRPRRTDHSRSLILLYSSRPSSQLRGTSSASVTASAGAPSLLVKRRTKNEPRLLCA